MGRDNQEACGRRRWENDWKYSWKVVVHAREGTPKETVAVGDPCWDMIPSKGLWPWATHARARTTLRDCIL